MILRDGLEALEGIPVLYVKKLSAIVCSDLHLGYEGVMADNGVFLPKINLRKIEEALKEAADLKSPERIIIDGDIKNEFSKVHIEEFNELLELVRFITDNLGIKEIILIKGNHDNFVDRLEKPLGLKIFRQEAAFGGILFLHGEEKPRAKRYDIMIMGHLHPMLLLRNSAGISEKLKCFLYGKARNGKEAIVLPAMNYFAEGLSVNEQPINGEGALDLLDIDNMRAICIGQGENLDFGKVGSLRGLT